MYLAHDRSLNTQRHKNGLEHCCSSPSEFTTSHLCVRNRGCERQPVINARNLRGSDEVNKRLFFLVIQSRPKGEEVRHETDEVLKDFQPVINEIAR